MNRLRDIAGLATLAAAIMLGSAQPARAQGNLTKGLETAIDEIVDLIGTAEQNGAPRGKIHGLDNALQQLLRVLENKGHKQHHHHGHLGREMSMLGPQDGGQDANQPTDMQGGKGGHTGKGTSGKQGGGSGKNCGCLCRGMQQISNQLAGNPGKQVADPASGNTGGNKNGKNVIPIPDLSDGLRHAFQNVGGAKGPAGNATSTTAPVSKAKTGPSTSSGTAKTAGQAKGGSAAAGTGTAKTDAKTANTAMAARKSGPAIQPGSKTTVTKMAPATHPGATKQTAIVAKTAPAKKSGNIASGLSHLSTKQTMPARATQSSARPNMVHTAANRQALGSPWTAKGTHLSKRK